MPIETINGNRGPRYLNWKYDQTQIAANSWGMMAFGFEPVCFVVADVSDADNVTLRSLSGVTSIPDNIDQLVGSASGATQSALESINVPADWVLPSMTFRQIIRIVLGMFMFFQRYQGLYGNIRIFGSGVTLGTTFGQIPAAVQASLSATALDLNLKTTGLTSSTTVRQILKSMANQFASVPIFVGGVQI